ncbi:hypothetical protein EDC01DRAFT_358035 [Geopyxis carbonaria]|nr:hypothetical protein EDC01DRAFT_358035 [Geopyxis carbonaria]
MITAGYRLAVATSRCSPCWILFRREIYGFQKRPVFSFSNSTSRDFHQSGILRNSDNPSIETKHQETKNEGNQLTPTLNEGSAKLKESGEDNGLAEEVPWYLRVETPKPPKYQLNPQMALPELPEDPPPILETLIQELSDGNGITELKLFDLRSMNPPPAIGANTITIVGTARSIKHLHATADKICRWLRSTHSARPHADGLLGRGELRKINRRKKRRGKVISEQMGEVEEVGSANWVCLQAGKEGLIVQLFTRGKREEVDIEGLLELQLERNEKRMVRNKEKMEQLQAKFRTHELKQGSEVFEDDVPSEPALQKCIPSASGPIIHTRAYSGLVRRTDKSYNPSYLLGDLDVNPIYRKARITKNDEITPQSEPIFEPDYPTLERFIDSIHSHSNPASLVGSGPSDQSSTSFLTAFHQELASHPDSVKIRYCLKFLAAANIYNPSYYPAKSLLEFLQVSKQAGKTITLEHYYLALDSIVTSTSSSIKSWSEDSDERLGNALSLIKSISIDNSTPLRSDQSEGILSRPEFKHALFKAVAPKKVSKIRKSIIADSMKPDEFSEESLNFGSYFWDPRIETYNHFPKDGAETRFSYTIKEHHLDTLTAMAMTNQWYELWIEWEKLPLHGINRAEDGTQMGEIVT